MSSELEMTHLGRLHLARLLQKEWQSPAARAEITAAAGEPTPWMRKQRDRELRREWQKRQEAGCRKQEAGAA